MKKETWCWATAARMFAKQHTDFDSNITQLEAVRAVATALGDGQLTDAELEDYPGDPGMGLMAINYYLGKTPSNSFDIATLYSQKFTETQLLSYLNQGQSIYICRSSPDTNVIGHVILIYGYVVIDGDYWYLIRDPWPVNTGDSRLMSYEKLCDDKNDPSTATTKPLYWSASIVLTNP